MLMSKTPTSTIFLSASPDLGGLGGKKIVVQEIECFALPNMLCHSEL